MNGKASEVSALSNIYRLPKTRHLHAGYMVSPASNICGYLIPAWKVHDEDLKQWSCLHLTQQLSANTSDVYARRVCDNPGTALPARQVTEDRDGKAVTHKYHKHRQMVALGGLFSFDLVLNRLTTFLDSGENMNLSENSS